MEFFLDQVMNVANIAAQAATSETATLARMNINQIVHRYQYVQKEKEVIDFLTKALIVASVAVVTIETVSFVGKMTGKLIRKLF